MAEFVVKYGWGRAEYMRVEASPAKIDWVSKIERADAFDSPQRAMEAYEAAKAEMVKQGMAILAKAAARGAVEPSLPADWREGEARLRADKGTYRIGPAGASLLKIKSMGSCADPVAFFVPKWLSESLRGYNERVGVDIRAGAVDMREDFDAYYVKSEGRWLRSSSGVNSSPSWVSSMLLASAYATAAEARVALSLHGAEGYVVGCKARVESVERVGGPVDPQCEEMAARVEARALRSELSAGAPAPASKKSPRM